MMINTALTINKLNDEIVSSNVKYTKKKIHSFNEIKEKIIVNCSGYGSKELCEDKDMVSVQGHLIVLKNQNLKT